MGIIQGTMSIAELAEAIYAAGEFSTLADVINSGYIYVVEDSAVGGLVSISGGPGTAITSSVSTALEVAQSANLAASQTMVDTAAITAIKTQTGFKLAGLMGMELGSLAAAVAPVLGVSIGASLYESNPKLWTDISAKLLPFCYPGTTKIPTWLDIAKDATTGSFVYGVLCDMGIIDAMKDAFEDNDVSLDKTYSKTNGTITISGDSGGRVALDIVKILYGANDAVIITDGSCYGSSTGNEAYFSKNVVVGYAGGYTWSFRGWVSNLISLGISVTTNPYTNEQIQSLADNQMYPEFEHDPTAGVQRWGGTQAPAEPVVWPSTPIIIVPDPLGPGYEPIPVTPFTPIPLPSHPDPLPLPEHVPDPTPEEAPEDWPEEEPWPTTVPFPWTEPSTDPDPDWPEVMPWPLPEVKPEDWPTIPEDWPDTESWPEELPWPKTPEEWPETVPWPDTPPDDWPETVPWPESPDDWPEEIPWPTPWPENWPDDEPWPIKWPEEIPYPIPFPYPEPTPDPTINPDPGTIVSPETEVEPYIDPWPWPIPDPKDPKPKPKPTDDPSQPEPKPKPKPEGDRPPVIPEPPPSGTIDPAPPPIIPLPFSSTTGLISVYHPTQSELLSFCSWLWVTWQDATIDKIWNNPFDGIIALFELYCTPTDVGRKNIRSGFLDSGVSSETISRYTEIDCGSIGVPEYFGNYLDYAPYSKCHIYLPFIGVVELNVDDIVGHGVNVTYRIDEYNGSCIAMITVAKSTTVNGTEVNYSNIMYQFSGNCAVDLPIAGGSQAAIKAGMLEAAAWGLGSVIGGIMGGASPLSIGSDLAYGAGNAVHSLVSAKSSVQHSGSFGSSFGALGNKKPFIIVTRPKQIQVPNYQELYGYPAHKMVIINECTGYLRCREVHVISPTASDEEKTLIETMLKEGVYISE